MAALASIEKNAVRRLLFFLTPHTPRSPRGRRSGACRAFQFGRVSDQFQRQFAPDQLGGSGEGGERDGVVFRIEDAVERKRCFRPTWLGRVEGVMVLIF
jgi:hypothetical protein